MASQPIAPSVPALQWARRQLLRLMLALRGRGGYVYSPLFVVTAVRCLNAFGFSVLSASNATILYRVVASERAGNRHRKNGDNGDAQAAKQGSGDGAGAGASAGAGQGGLKPGVLVSEDDETGLHIAVQRLSTKINIAGTLLSFFLATSIGAVIDSKWRLQATVAAVTTTGLLRTLLGLLLRQDDDGATMRHEAEAAGIAGKGTISHSRSCSRSLLMPLYVVYRVTSIVTIPTFFRGVMSMSMDICGRGTSKATETLSTLQRYVLVVGLCGTYCGRWLIRRGRQRRARSSSRSEDLNSEGSCSRGMHKAGTDVVGKPEDPTTSLLLCGALQMLCGQYACCSPAALLLLPEQC